VQLGATSHSVMTRIPKFLTAQKHPQPNNETATCAQNLESVSRSSGNTSLHVDTAASRGSMDPVGGWMESVAKDKTSDSFKGA